MRITYKFLFFIWFGLIVFASVVPNSAGDQSLLSKMALTRSGFFLHVFGYFVLTALAFFAFEKKRFWLYLVGIVLMGVLFEGVQYVMPTRTFNLYDVVANGVGILLFVFIWVIFISHRHTPVPSAGATGQAQTDTDICSTVISDSQFPVSFKGSSQRLSIGFRLRGKPIFDGSLDHVSIFRINFRQVRFSNVRMVF